MKRIRPRAGFAGNAAATLFLALLSASAFPQAQTTTITNTADVSYEWDPSGGGGTVMVDVTTNTVVLTVTVAPTPGVIDFNAWVEPGTAGAIDLAVDGGQCGNDQGTWGPIPTMSDGAVGSVDAAAPSLRTDVYMPGEPVLVRVEDQNRNADPAVREYVTITATSSEGDEERLRLQETGPDTGIFATMIHSVAMPPVPARHDCALSVQHDTLLTATYADPDFPSDTASTTATVVEPPAEQAMVLDMRASVSEASVGDFVPYRLLLENPGAQAVHSVRVTDTLPLGFSFQEGSLRVAGIRVQPEATADPRTLLVPVGTLAAGGSVDIRYVLQVGPNTPAGDAVNGAIARGMTGQAFGGAPVKSNHGAAAVQESARVASVLVSNHAQASVLVMEPLFTSHFTIIGTVMAGACDLPDGALVPVAGARLLLDDGTYVATDENGAYHFEGVRPGTHVVQLDGTTLPAGMAAQPCGQDTRLAGRGHSRFVEAEGGALMRADFRVQPAAPREGHVGLALRLAETDGQTSMEVAYDVGGIPVEELRAMVMLPEGFAVVPGSVSIDDATVADPGLAEGVATFPIGRVPAGTRGTIRFLVDGTCAADGRTARAVALFEADGDPLRTVPSDATLACGAGAVVAQGERQSKRFTASAAADAATSPFDALAARRQAAADRSNQPVDARDWFAGQAPGNAWLWPEGTAVGPTEDIVVKVLPGHRVRLRLNGEAVGPLHAAGARTNPGRTVSVSMWRGVPMDDGDNRLEADIVDGGGNVVETLERTLRLSNQVMRAELVPGESILVADGIHRPVIAVRMLDAGGRPVRSGVTGSFRVAPPYLPEQSRELQQGRQLAGLESHDPTWRVEGGDGMAYIELQPTTRTGEAQLEFEFAGGGMGQSRRQTSRQQVRAWLRAQSRDWIVVGFAKGTIGHDTLAGNAEALDAAGQAAGYHTDGQLSLYAKGRVRGEWLLTLAYDSDKHTDRRQRRNLLSTIDPNEFYLLYGDGTEQGYDAASIEKVYIKLERDQFYALFGDYATGLDDTQLSRYSRVLNGLKVEYQGPLFELNAFAAETSQGLGHEELQGDGTSGLYRLSRRDILVNGERVRIEVRDRHRSERVIESRPLTRHLDYEIDYAAGTLFFREPVPSRDFDFNPVFIVVDYEIRGTGEQYLNAGGRAGVTLLDGRLEAGLTVVRDQDAMGRSTLAGLDARYDITPATVLRAEVAASEGRADGEGTSGSAYLVELEHHGERLDLLAYVRRSGDGFGLGQQSFSERGMFKAGADVQWRISDTFAVQARGWHQEDLVGGATRDALHVQGEYRGADWGVEAGLQWVHDRALDGRTADSQLLTLGARRSLGRLDLTAQADLALGKRDSVDFPARIELGASYALTETFRLVVAQEFTDGDDRDTATTRVGFQAQPWAGATLASTLNQSRISEYGPRTFAVMGLAQKFPIGERWSVDLSVDGSQSFDESGREPLLANPDFPIAPGGMRGVAALTEDFTALSGGATYRNAQWSWTGRLEHRDGEQADRAGLTTGFLRQARDGVAFGASAQAFEVDNADGSQGLLASAMLSWAWRPLGGRWSLLDRLEFRLDQLERRVGDPVAGDALAVSGDSRSMRLVNNLVLNFVGDPWTREDRRGNLFDVAQRSHLSLYYGSKYVFDTYDDDDHSGYTDILGIDWRHDLSERFDIGLRASVRHAWDTGDVAYAFGPGFGFVPFTNAWFSLGYNVVGFDDRDFQAMHYTAQGPYLMLRFKFDQETFGLDRTGEGAAR